jgi:glycine cleavage system protein P-like pyridoxal-binding family
MKTTYETLDDYLDALDAIKEQVAEETQGMTAKQVKAYFARAPQTLEQTTGQRLRVRRGGRKGSTAKR